MFSPSLFRFASAAYAQNKAKCVSDVSGAAGDITNAGLTINAAVEDCKDFGPDCVDDIDSIVDSLDSAANYVR